MRAFICVFRRNEVEKYLEELQRELEQLKEKRAQDVQKVDAVARQRDMFRMLLSQATGVTFPQQGEVTCACASRHSTPVSMPCEFFNLLDFNKIEI